MKRLLLISVLLSGSAFAAAGDISAVRILGNTCAAGANCNGFIAEIDIANGGAAPSTGGTYNFGFTAATAGASVDGLAKVKFTVTSPGYNTAGVLGTITRYVYGTMALRKPYPNQATNDETAGSPVTVRVLLSEFVYSGDTVTVTITGGASAFYSQGGQGNNAVSNLAVTNNSTYAYAKPVGRWAWVAYERVTSDFLLEATVFHRFAQNGKPLAALKYTCTDEHSNTATATVNNMTVSTRPHPAGTGEILVYAATIPIAGFTQGDVITCNFTAYPWVGNSTALLNSDLVANGGDGFAQPDERLGPFAVLNDKSGTYGTPCAVVDPANGHASALATWTYASCAAAEAAYAGDNTLSYTTVGYAAQGVKAYNNANHGHNDPGGGTVELIAGNHTLPGTTPASALGTQKTWLTIQPLSTVGCQVPVFNANGNAELKSTLAKYVCIATLTTTGNTFKGVSTYTDTIWLDQMKLNSTEGRWLGYYKGAYITRSTLDALGSMELGNYSTVKNPWLLVRGNIYAPLNTATGPAPKADLFAVLGNRNFRGVPREAGNAGGTQISDNAIYAFNQVYNDNNNSPLVGVGVTATATTFSAGMAVVQNVLESVNAAGVQPNLLINNQGSTNTANNFIFWHNTNRGQRSNVAYDSTVGYCSTGFLFSNWTWKYNLDSNQNRIGDTRNDHGCGYDGGRTFNWATTFMVGGAGNALAVGGGPSWSAPEYLGLFTMGDPATEGFVSDKSSTTYGGAGGGNGDYHLRMNSSLRNIIPAGAAVLPFDLEGNPRSNTGGGAIGAYEAAQPHRSRGH